MQYIFIRSFSFYLDKILMLSLGDERPSSVLLKFFGLIGSDISMLNSKCYHFIRWLAEAFSNAVLQKHNGLLHFWWNWKAVGTSVSCHRNCVTQGVRIFFMERIRQRIATNHSFNYKKRFYSKWFLKCNINIRVYICFDIYWISNCLKHLCHERHTTSEFTNVYLFGYMFFFNQDS